MCIICRNKVTSETKEIICCPDVSKIPNNLPNLTFLNCDNTKITEIPNNLQNLKVRPSRVITRDRAVTQSWALKVFKGGKSAGISWWSYYNPDWSCVGLWDLSKLKTTHIDALGLDNSWVDEASRATNKLVLH